MTEVRSAHVQAKLVKRSEGRNVIAAAAYRSGENLIDRRDFRSFDYSRRQQVLATRLIAPEGASEWITSRNALWNLVEETERRKDAQLARELEVSIPAELDQTTRDELVWQFCEEQFVQRGMIADVAIHGPAEGEGLNFHFHALLTMRELGEDGFGKKVRAWNDNALLDEWKDAWIALCNAALERKSVDVRLDRRSIEERREAALAAAEAATDWIEERRHLIEAERLNYTPRPHLPRTPYLAMEADQPIPDYKGTVDGVPMPDKWRQDVAAWKAARKSRDEARKRADEMEQQLEAEIAALSEKSAAFDQADAEDSAAAAEQQQAFEIIAAMFDPQKPLDDRNNAATALMVHHPEWQVETIFKKMLPELANVQDVREVSALLTTDHRAARRLDDEIEQYSDWDDLHDDRTALRDFGSTLAENRTQPWARVEKNLVQWVVGHVAETIKRAVTALASILRQERLDLRNRPAPPPDKADSGSVKPDASPTPPRGSPSSSLKP